jgi:glycosyltransferase involved in cell wall biosynthesis
VRLLFLTDRLSDRGGADHHLHQIIGWASEAGFGVTVAFGRDEGGIRLPDGAIGRRIRGLAGRVDSSSRLGGLTELVDGSDVVHVQNVMNPRVLAVAAASGRMVVTIQDHRVLCPGPGKTLPDGSACITPMADRVCRSCLPDDGYRRRMLELTGGRLEEVRRARAVIVLSRYMAKELEAVGVPGARVVPPWVEIGPTKTDPGSFLLLGGRLVTHKGVLDGWRAWEAAHRPMPLVVAGAGPLEGELRGVDLRGWLDPSELRSTLCRARALLVPGRWQEPFGILGLEALAQGTPVVVASTGGTGEWAGDGCVRVPAGDPVAMAGAVIRLAGDPDGALELGRFGQRVVGRRFARAPISAMLRDIYAGVARRRSTLERPSGG